MQRTRRTAPPDPTVATNTKSETASVAKDVNVTEGRSPDCKPLMVHQQYASLAYSPSPSVMTLPGLGFGVLGSGFMVYGLGLRV